MEPGKIEKINPLLFVDLETSGLNPEVHSVLEISGVWFDIFTHSYEEAFHFFVRESNNIICDPKSMEINGIDLNFIKENGLISYKAIEKIREVIKNKIGEEHRKIVLAGHNVKFDIAFLKKLYETAGDNFDQDFDYHSFSTDTLLMFMMMCGKSNETFPRLKKWTEINDVVLDRTKRHSAKEDILATVQSLANFLKKWELHEKNR